MKKPIFQTILWGIKGESNLDLSIKPAPRMWGDRVQMPGATVWIWWVCHGNMPQRGCNGNTHCVSENGGRIPIPGQQWNGVPMRALCSDPNPLWVLRILPWWIGFSPLNTWGATSHKWLLVSDMHVTWYNHPQIWDLNNNLEYHPEM